MQFKFTKRAQEAFKINLEIFEETDFYSWHVELIYVNRKKTLIFVNDLTKFAFPLFDVSKKDFDRYLFVLFSQGLLACGTYFNMDIPLLLEYLSHCGPLHTTKTDSRSVLGALKEKLFALSCDDEVILTQTSFFEDLNGTMIQFKEQKTVLYCYEYFDQLLKTTFKRDLSKS